MAAGAAAAGSPANKTQLWDLIGQITVQVDQLMDQDPETKKALSL